MRASPRGCSNTDDPQRHISRNDDDAVRWYSLQALLVDGAREMSVALACFLSFEGGIDAESQK
jgi:hypothetical protein